MYVSGIKHIEAMNLRI